MNFGRKSFLNKIENSSDKDRSTLKPTCTKNSLEQNEQWIRKQFINCSDVKIQKMNFQKKTENIDVLLVYCEGMADTKLINKTIIPSIHHFFNDMNNESFKENELLAKWQISSLQKEVVLDHLITKIFSGQLVLFFDGLDAAYILDIADLPRRNPEEANTEISIRGPRDGFIEDISINIALVRKRLKTTSLSYEQYVIGKRGNTKVGLLFIEDIMNPDVLSEVRNRLSKIDIDALLSSSELEEFLQEHKLSLFPQFEYSGRADYVASILIKGRFAILVDGSPTAIIAPVNLSLLIKTPEDFHNPFYFVSFQRMLRIIGFWLALFAPGFYVAMMTFHQDQIPLTLLATFVTARKGVPLPTPIEAIIMMLLFELFREAGVRLPSAIGQTLAVVGGLIIGDAAIRAGLTSPSMLVITAASAVATFTLVNQGLSGTVSILRLGVLVVSSVFGIFGFFLGLILIFIWMANLRSFGLPYLAPISPLSLPDFFQTVIRLPSLLVTKRPRMLDPIDETRMGREDNE